VVDEDDLLLGERRHWRLVSPRGSTDRDELLLSQRRPLRLWMALGERPTPTDTSLRKGVQGVQTTGGKGETKPTTLLNNTTCLAGGALVNESGGLQVGGVILPPEDLALDLRERLQRQALAVVERHDSPGRHWLPCTVVVVGAAPICGWCLHSAAAFLLMMALLAVLAVVAVVAVSSRVVMAVVADLEKSVREGGREQGSACTR
jgi:hypothetical protein